MGKVQKMPTIRRLPTYLHKLNEMRRRGVEIVATPELAQYMNLEAIVVRKDLAATGVTGQPGVGYKVVELIESIRTFLSWDNTSEAVLVGAGSLGSAILGYEGFEEYGLRIIAAFDADQDKVGTIIHDREVFDISRLAELTKRMHVPMGIICVPPEYAQNIADQLIAGGVRGIWSFANVSLKVPDDVVVQREVIAGGLAVLSVKLGKLMRDQKLDD